MAPGVALSQPGAQIGAQYPDSVLLVGYPVHDPGKAVSYHVHCDQNQGEQVVERKQRKKEKEEDNGWISKTTSLLLLTDLCTFLLANKLMNIPSLYIPVRSKAV